MSDQPAHRPWLVRIHHRMRTVSFAMVFGATCLDLINKDFGVGTWAFLVALLLIYPHIQYWRSLRAVDSIGVELGNLRADGFLLGIFIAAVHFSDWLTFSVMMGSLSNSAANKGWRGIRDSLFALAAGVLAGVAVVGFTFNPHTEWPAALACILGLGGYLLAMNNLGFARNVELRRARKQLELHEAELVDVNEALRKNLEEIDQLQGQLREQANRDPLTNLFNRRFLDSSLSRELARCSREGQPLSLLMIDVDHFKKYNDHYGHQSGDECLRRVAEVLKGSAKRASDLAARYGGEEFVLVLTDTDSATAAHLAQEVLDGIELLALPHAVSKTGRVTVSIGAATATRDAYGDVDSLLRAADQALYRAKHCGRNQLQVAPDTPQQIGSGDRVTEDELRLVWGVENECGHPDIDDAHRNLFAQCNQLLTNALSGSASSVVAQLADTLIRDLGRHFREEEEIIAKVGFPNAAEHSAGHSELIEQAHGLVARFRANEIDLAEFFRFLGHDVVARHMLEKDRAFIPYL